MLLKTMPVHLNLFFKSRCLVNSYIKFVTSQNILPNKFITIKLEIISKFITQHNK